VNVLNSEKPLGAARAVSHPRERSPKYQTEGRRTDDEYKESVEIKRVAAAAAAAGMTGTGTSPSSKKGWIYSSILSRLWLCATYIG
jgi:hypothetical protein